MPLFFPQTRCIVLELSPCTCFVFSVSLLHCTRAYCYGARKSAIHSHYALVFSYSSQPFTRSYLSSAFSFAVEYTLRLFAHILTEVKKTYFSLLVVLDLFCFVLLLACSRLLYIDTYALLFVVCCLFYKR